MTLHLSLFSKGKHLQDTCTIGNTGHALGFERNKDQINDIRCRVFGSLSETHVGVIQRTILIKICQQWAVCTSNLQKLKKFPHFCLDLKPQPLDHKTSVLTLTCSLQVTLKDVKVCVQQTNQNVVRNINQKLSKLTTQQTMSVQIIQGYSRIYHPHTSRPPFIERPI